MMPKIPPDLPQSLILGNLNLEVFSETNKLIVIFNLTFYYVCFKITYSLKKYVIS